MTRSNVLIEHVLGEQHPAPGDTWRLRKGDRQVVVHEVYGAPGVVCDSVVVFNRATGRRTVIRRDTLIARYIKVDPAKAAG